MYVAPMTFWLFADCIDFVDFAVSADFTDFADSADTLLSIIFDILILENIGPVGSLSLCLQKNSEKISLIAFHCCNSEMIFHFSCYCQKCLGSKSEMGLGWVGMEICVRTYSSVLKRYYISQMTGISIFSLPKFLVILCNFRMIYGYFKDLEIGKTSPAPSAPCWEKFPNNWRFCS